MVYSYVKCINVHIIQNLISLVSPRHKRLHCLLSGLPINSPARRTPFRRLKRLTHRPTPRRRIIGYSDQGCWIDDDDDLLFGGIIGIGAEAPFQTMVSTPDAPSFILLLAKHVQFFPEIRFSGVNDV